MALFCELTSVNCHLHEHLEALYTGVTLAFLSPEESYHAGVVIGSDGYQSQVRAMCLQDAPPTVRNEMCWQGVVDWPEYWPHPKAYRVT